MPSLRSCLVLAVSCVTPVAAQSNAERAMALQGAWRFVETASPRTFQVTDNQPGWLLFVDGHYSTVQVNGLRPRTAVDSTSTALQLWNTYGPNFTAQAGAFEVRGDTLITRPTVAKNPAVMAPDRFNRFLYRMMGNDLSLTFIATQAGPVTNVLTSSYQRVRAAGAPTN
jgi:hypothetical protein